MKNFFNHNSLTVFEKEDVVKNLFKIFNFDGKCGSFFGRGWEYIY